MSIENFLKEDDYVDFTAPIIMQKVEELFKGVDREVDKARIAYEFVRDEVSHIFDTKEDVVKAKASEVLQYKAGICHSKACLLAALLRAVGIPAGFCFQHLTLADDDSLGYCVHAYNAVFVENHWIRLDARGNKEGVDAQFSIGEPILAFKERPQYDEYTCPGIYATPHKATMKMLEEVSTMQEILDSIPDYILGEPDSME